MAKGNWTGPISGGRDAGRQIPTVARETSLLDRQEAALRRAEQLGVPPRPIATQIIQTITDPAGANLLDQFLRRVFRGFQQHTRQPSHQYPPYLAQSIDSFGTGTFAAGEEKYVVSLDVPAGHRGVLVGFGHDVSDANAWNDVTWSIRQGDFSEAPYVAVTDQVGTVLNPWRHSVIHIREKQTVGLWALNGGAASYTLRGRIVGWFYPIRHNVDGFAETLQE